MDACHFENPAIPVIGNVHARPLRNAEEARADLKAQMGSRVRWTESVQYMLETGTQAFVEVGSGSVLLGLIRRIQPDAAGYPLGKPSDFSNFVV